jgi:hypothetical protein
MRLPPYATPAHADPARAGARSRWTAGAAEEDLDRMSAGACEAGLAQTEGEGPEKPPSLATRGRRGGTVVTWNSLVLRRER